ncbi:MAG: hypothetical protein ACI9TV_000750 [Sulfurimonas sp.]|jgi:hypothetical protein|uniref:hypothetical protein n=1 Tax=Sulfurimonas sp. TaxID=2022749 RepID=UPI0039E3E653
MDTSKKLLRLCGYTQNSSSLHRVEQIKKNYSEFSNIVTALLDLESYLQHSDFYISLKDDYDLIEIRNDLYNEDELLMLDGDIVVWANQHNIEFLENTDNISILGFKHNE